MEKQIFSAKSVTDALQMAADSFGVDVDEISHTILQQPSGGLLSKFFSKGVKLEAWVQSDDKLLQAARNAVAETIVGTHKTPTPVVIQSSPKKGPMPSAAHKESKSVKILPKTDIKPHGKTQPKNEKQHAPIAESRDKGPTTPLTSPDLQPLLHEFVTQFLGGLKCTPEFELQQFKDSDDILIAVQDTNLEKALGESDKLSAACEHLFRRIVQRKLGVMTSGRLNLNAGNAQDSRIQSVEKMALTLADQVCSTGKPVTLSSRSSQERRIIHMALDGHTGVKTKSSGVGEHRKLIIYSTNAAHNRNSHQGHARRKPAAKKHKPIEPQGS